MTSGFIIMHALCYYLIQRNELRFSFINVSLQTNVCLSQKKWFYEIRNRCLDENNRYYLWQSFEIKFHAMFVKLMVFDVAYFTSLTFVENISRTPS